MTGKEITKEFLWLLSRGSKNTAARQGFRALLERASGKGEWPAVIEARLLAFEKKTTESIALLNDVLAREPRNACASLVLAAALSFDNNQPEDAIGIYDALLRQGFQDQALPNWLEALTLFSKGVTLGKSGKSEEAIGVYDEVVKRFGESQEVTLQEQVAWSLFNKGVTLGQLSRSEEEIGVYDEVVKRFGESMELPLQEQVANALFNKGVTLGELGKSEEEIGVYDELVRRAGDSEEAPLQWPVARALLYKGVTLGQLGKSEEAIGVYDEVVKRFGESAEAPLQEQVARALFNKGVTLGQLGKSEEEIGVYDEVVKRFGESAEAPLQEQVAKALVNKGGRLGQLGKSEDEIGVYDEVVKRFGESAEVPLQEQVASALFNKGVTLGQLGKSEEAIGVYDEVVKRFGESAEAPLQEQVASALVNKGVRLGQLGKSEEEIGVYAEVVKRFGESQEVPLQEEVARALFNKGVTLGQLGKSEEELAAYDELVERFGESMELPLQEPVAKALVNKGVALGQLSKPEEEIGVYDEVVKRFGESEEAPLREQVARALLYKAESLLDTNKKRQAFDLFTSVEKDYLSSEELRSKLASYYAYLHSRFASRGMLEAKRLDTEPGRTALDITRQDLGSNLRVYLNLILQRIGPKKQEDYFAKMEEVSNRRDHFIRADSQFASDFSFLLVLREWNSYTPVIPQQEESDRGGGYFIRHAGEGIVIDPGYDFIENFHRAGGVLGDVDHVIVTHAHDDHTAQLEALLMLFQRRWTSNLPRKKRVSLYLSAGVQRKFAGLLDLRDRKYKRIITLTPGQKDFEQRIMLNSDTQLTVLPAYHDDVITHDSAVGLAFEFATANGARRVVFTGDSGLYPRKLGEDGKARLYDDDPETPMLDVTPGKALYDRYPARFRNPDLFVAHIGSIKKSEFDVPKETRRSSMDEGRWYYVNHLGLLGTLTMLHKLDPEAAVISEFGSELKGFHFDLVDIVKEILHERQKKDSRKESFTFVIPGDLTIAYDITNHRFLCHETCTFEAPDNLCCRQAVDYESKKKESVGNAPEPREGTARTYLFGRRKRPVKTDAVKDNRAVRKYFQKLFDHELPYHKKEVKLRRMKSAKASRPPIAGK